MGHLSCLTFSLLFSSRRDDKKKILNHHSIWLINQKRYQPQTTEKALLTGSLTWVSVFSPLKWEQDLHYRVGAVIPRDVTYNELDPWKNMLCTEAAIITLHSLSLGSFHLHILYILWCLCLVTLSICFFTLYWFQQVFVLLPIDLSGSLVEMSSYLLNHQHPGFPEIFLHFMKLFKSSCDCFWPSRVFVVAHRLSPVVAQGL